MKGVVLAAGFGTRLAPLTDHCPKALCTVAGVPLLDRAIATLAPHVDDLAVNACHLAEQIVAHLAGRRHVSVEAPRPFGSAGALVALRDWIGEDDVAVLNADTVILGDVGPFLREHRRGEVRLLVHEDRARPDFDRRWRFSGLSVLPNAELARLPDPPCDLYRTTWAPRRAEGRLALVPLEGWAIDCGTPADYLAANLALNGGRAVVAPDARVEGEVVESVVLSGAVVHPGERLRRAIRTADGHTIVV